MTLRAQAVVVAAAALLVVPVAAQSPDSSLRGHGGPVRAITVLPDGRVASAGFDSAIIVWDVAAGHAVRVLRFHDTSVNALAVRADGCLLSAGEDARIAVWCGSAAPAQILAGHAGSVSALALAPAGQMLASAGWDRTEIGRAHV